MLVQRVVVFVLWRLPLPLFWLPRELVGKVFIEFIGGVVYKSVATCRMNWFKRFLYEKKSVEEVRSWLSSMALEVVDSASALRKEELDEVKACLAKLDKVMAVRKEQEEIRLGFLEQAKLFYS